MTFAPTEETLARPRLTIHAAEVFHAHASEIELECAAAAEDELIVARIDAFGSYLGATTVARESLASSIPGDAGGWSLIFSPGTSLPDVEERCLRLARSAFRRWEALRRWESGHRSAT